MNVKLQQLACITLVTFVVASAAGCSCAGEGHTPTCECETDRECSEDEYCDGCRCVEKCTTSADCPSSSPNCDQETGRCEAPCPEYTCPDDLPNCDHEGVCTGPCSDSGDCTNPETPNCGEDGICFGPCTDHLDCVHPDYPNCDPESGVCQGECPETDCPSALPNCDPETGLCQGPCPEVPCPEGMINCTRSGVCFGPCSAHSDCIDSAMPNCDLDPDSPTFGICLEPCHSHEDCPSSLYPNCDPSAGVCLPPCTDHDDCPGVLWKCDTDTGLCFEGECEDDTQCSPPETVCEEWFCVPGCEDHEDCDAEERCDLVDEDNMNHCEPRDCLTDADCTDPGMVCDTDGLVDPDGGGYCVPGCETFYDCTQLGYDCDPATGACSEHDYGDIGADCSDGCDSGFCLTDEGNLCTDFCCIQHDCPADWGCRPHDDGSGDDTTVDVCVPLDTSFAMRRYNEICLDGEDCRSGICAGATCRETCCTDSDCNVPFLSDMYCGISGETGITACFTEPTTDNDPLGTPGCGTSGSPGDCRSNLCFSFYLTDADCASDADCPARRPTCWDVTENGTNDCVRDFCIEHCCGASDCPDYGTEIFACSKWLFGLSDYDICMIHDGAATLQEGEACTNNGDCRSMVCSDDAGLCRRRCCTDADCTNPLYPQCGLEQNHVFSNPRLLNVCLPR